jgi:hypothetical protein
MDGKAGKKERKITGVDTNEHRTQTRMLRTGPGVK